MEVGKIQSVDMDQIRVRSSATPFMTKLLNLEVGQGFEVEGVDRAEISGRMSTIGKKTKRSFSSKKIEFRKYLIYRWA